MLNKSDIARDVGVAVKTPKLYFSDTGLLSYLLGIDETNVHGSPFLGAVWETFVFAELRKELAVTDNTLNLWFYRDQRAREIDFLLESAGRLSFLEAKCTEYPAQRHSETMATIEHELRESRSGLIPGSRFVIAGTEEAYPLADGTRVLPVADLTRAFAAHNRG